MEEEVSLVAQWKRISLPIKETRVRSMFWKDFPRASWEAKPEHHNC